MAAKRLYRTTQLHTGAFAILTCRITRREARLGDGTGGAWPDNGMRQTPVQKSYLIQRHLV